MLRMIFLLLCAPLSAQAQLPAGAVSIETFEISGAGCPQGSVRPTLASDGSALSLLFDQMTGEVEPGTRIVRVVCDVRLVLRKPASMTYAIASADFRGFVSLEAGVRATQKVRLVGGFDEIGRREVNLSQQNWIGPVQQEFNFSAVRPDEGVQVVGCARLRDRTMIRLRTAIVLRNKRAIGTGTVMVDSFDGGLEQRYNLSWTDCRR